MKALRATLDNLSLRGLQDTLRARYAASAQKDVLADVDTSLVLVDDTLINTATGEQRALATGDAESLPWAEQIAEAASQLLRNRADSAAILLLLPPADFVATQYNLGISGEKLLRSALKLQAHTLIPAYDEPLMLAIDGRRAAGVALWYPQQRAELLFHAFQSRNLLLAALMPRILALPQLGPDSENLRLHDEDASHQTLAHVQHGRLTALLGIHQHDLRDEAFAGQWQQETARLPAGIPCSAEGLSWWAALRQQIVPLENWSFIPAGAQRVGRELIARKQRKFAGIALAAACVLLVLPFVNNWIQIQRLESRVEDLREQSTLARQSQAEVYELEERWGAVADYPRQDVIQVLLTLNQLLSNALSSFEINRGQVDITGFSPDPALLLEQLAEREQFYNVGQSRSSSVNNAAAGDRFGIRFNVSGVDFAAYEQRYPVTEQ